MSKKFLSFLSLVFLLSIFLFANATAAQGSEGRLLVKYENTKDYSDTKAFIEERPNFRVIIEGINKHFIFPQDLTLKFTDGNEGPYYDPNTKEIHISYGDFNFIANMYHEKYPKADAEQIRNFTMNAEIACFYHELGHAMINIYGLPVTDVEETAVDNLSVIFALEFTSNGFRIVTDFAEFWGLLEDWRAKNQGKRTTRDFWEEHELNPQRFYNIICMLYGKNPEKFSRDILHGGLDPKTQNTLQTFVTQKKDFCEVQYQKTYQAWMKLLAPHLRG